MLRSACCVAGKRVGGADPALRPRPPAVPECGCESAFARRCAHAMPRLARLRRDTRLAAGHCRKTRRPVSESSGGVDARLELALFQASLFFMRRKAAPHAGQRSFTPFSVRPHFEAATQ
jgi:hypothetical protein